MIKIQKGDMDAKGEVTLVFGKQVSEVSRLRRNRLTDMLRNSPFRIRTYQEKVVT